MSRLSRSGLFALLVLAAAPAKAEDIVITQFGAAFAGNPFAVGIEGGYFKKAGVNITGVIAGAGGGTSVRNVIASELGYGEVVLSAAVAAIQEGQDIKVVNVGARTVADIRAVLGDDYWPYGLAKNRRSLEAALRYSHAQGLSARPLTIEEAFVPDLDWAVRV